MWHHSLTMETGGGGRDYDAPRSTAVAIGPHKASALDQECAEQLEPNVC